MPVLSLTAVFDVLPDPRRDTSNNLHVLTDLLANATCTAIGWAESWEAIAESGGPRPTSSSGFYRWSPASRARTRSTGGSSTSCTACSIEVVFRENDSRVRAGHADENLAMVRRLAVSLPQRAPGKGTTPTKRLKAGCDDDYLL